jgi:dihydroxyacetone kinase
MKQFINDKETVVTNAIDGVIGSSGGCLAKLDGFPHIKVVVRTDWDKSKVALVSVVDPAMNQHMPDLSDKVC